MNCVTTREEAIIAAQAERNEALARIKAKLAPGSEDESCFEFILRASVIGRQKLAEAKAASDCTIYNNWRYFDFHDHICNKEQKRFHSVSSLFAQENIPLLDFIGVDLSGAQLGWKPTSDWQMGFDARGADFTGANFENADLTGFLTNPPGHRLHWCNFRGANLSNPDPASLPEGQYCMGRLEGGEFGCSDFIGANLSRQMFNDAEMDNCDFSDANISAAERLNASFKGSKFNGANISNSEIYATAFEGAVCDDKTDLAGAKIQGDITQLNLSFRRRWEFCNPSAASLGQSGSQQKWSRE